MLKFQLYFHIVNTKKNNADILVSVAFQIHVLQCVDTLYRIENIFAFLLFVKKSWFLKQIKLIDLLNDNKNIYII